MWDILVWFLCNISSVNVNWLYGDYASIAPSVYVLTFILRNTKVRLAGRKATCLQEVSRPAPSYGARLFLLPLHPKKLCGEYWCTTLCYLSVTLHAFQQAQSKFILRSSDFKNEKSDFLSVESRSKRLRAFCVLCISQSACTLWLGPPVFPEFQVVSLERPMSFI